MYSVAYGIDKFVINSLCEDATGALTTPAGGFTTASNINKIMGDLLGNVAGYENNYLGGQSGLFLVAESTDVTGFAQAGATNGYAWSDAHLRNGLMGSWMGVDLYFVRSGTFVDDTLGTKTVTNSGHRVFGVKGVATYASPRGMNYEEKGVTTKTGKEIVVFGLVGFKLWAVNTALVVDITLA